MTKLRGHRKTTPGYGMLLIARVNRAGGMRRRLVAAGFAMRRQQSLRISSNGKIEQGNHGAKTMTQGDVGRL
ncbi:hypothetical protein NL676_007945 [Syzygium grande]|nr:hypothetical protein NL676_007945 [Syzygium grande]